MTNYNQVETVFRKKLRTISLKLDRQFVCEPSRNEKISDPWEVFYILKALFATLDDNQEHLILLVLNQSNQVTGYKVLSSGSQDASLIDCKILFRTVLLLGARTIIIAHNHPSESLRPSREDLVMTRKIAAAAKLLDVRLLDHLIVTHRDFVSLAETHSEYFIDNS